ncbi:MAG: hypothetical protein ACR2M0_15590 [Chloroflexia bacterium]
MQTPEPRCWVIETSSASFIDLLKKRVSRLPEYRIPYPAPPADSEPPVDATGPPKPAPPQSGEVVLEHELRKLQTGGTSVLPDKKLQQFGLDAFYYSTRLSRDDLGTVTVGPEWKLQNPAIKFDIRTLGERRTIGGLSESLIQVEMVCVEPLFTDAFRHIATQIDRIVSTRETAVIRQAELDRFCGKEAADSKQFYVDASFSDFIGELNRIAATLQDERIREGSRLYTLTMPVRKIMWNAKKLDLTFIGDLTSFGDFTFIGKYTYYDQERREHVDLGHDIYFMSFIVHSVREDLVKVRAQCYMPALRDTFNRIFREIREVFGVHGSALASARDLTVSSSAQPLGTHPPSSQAGRPVGTGDRHNVTAEDLRKAYRSCEQRKGGPPTQQEIADEVKLPLKTLRRRKDELGLTWPRDFR